MCFHAEKKSKISVLSDKISTLSEAMIVALVGNHYHLLRYGWIQQMTNP